MRKIVAVLLATLMIVGMGMMAVFAQTVTYTGSGSTKDGSITVLNAAKGEEYQIYKLFDATLGTSGAIAYYGKIPDGLKTWFGYTSSGSGYVQYIGESGTELPSDARDAIATWAKTATPMFTEATVSDGSALKFAGLPYGYYVVTTTQGEAIISVDSANPDQVIHDKNSTTVTVKKEVENDSYSIGDTITYTATFHTTNYIGAGEEAQQVTKYVIKDTLPDFLSDVKITSLKINAPSQSGTGAELADLSADYKQFTNKQIEIPWADPDGSGSYKSKYMNGAVITITYTAVLTQVVKYSDDNKNTVSIEPYGGSGSGSIIPHDDSGTWQDSAVIRTYGAALKKVDENSGTLAGAIFEIANLIVEKLSNGVYRVVSVGSGTATVEVNDDGMLYILGLASGTELTVKETKAPEGYNLLTETFTLTPQPLTTMYRESSGSWYKDADGNVTTSSGSGVVRMSGSDDYTVLKPNAMPIVNEKGTLLPSTGGIGTTIFYIVGGLLAVGAGVVLVAKKRMGKVED